MKRNLKQIFLLILFLLCLISLTACFKPSEEEVKAKMKKELYEEYGEEFEVENIGLREANGEKFYQAKIYPKSIIGTPKEDDDYYYSTASVDVARFDKPNSVGNSYGVIKMNDEAEEYLLPKAKELFGNKIRIKANVEYKIKDGDFFTQYLVSGFEEKRKEALKNPNTHRFILTLYIYIFDKIDNEKEKEERRRQLFEFLQYLRAEKLDKYLEIDFNFIDDIILAPSFEEKRYDLENDLEKRKEHEVDLRNELENTRENQFLSNLERIKKIDISVSSSGNYYKYIKNYYQIITIDKLKLNEYGMYDEAKEKNIVNIFYYKSMGNIELKFLSDSYIFKDGE